MDDFFPKKDLVITTLLGLPKSWSAFASILNGWKDIPTFEKMWHSSSQEKDRISLVKKKKGARINHLEFTFFSLQEEGNLHEVQRTKEESGSIQY